MFGHANLTEGNFVSSYHISNHGAVNQIRFRPIPENYNKP